MNLRRRTFRFAIYKRKHKLCYMGEIRSIDTGRLKGRSPQQIVILGLLFGVKFNFLSYKSFFCRFFRQLVGLCLPMASSSESFPTSLRVKYYYTIGVEPEYSNVRTLVMPSTKLGSYDSWRRMERPSVIVLFSLRCSSLL